MKGAGHRDTRLSSVAASLQAFVALAKEANAYTLAIDARRVTLASERVDEQLVARYRDWCRQLWRHLSEQQRALAASEQDAITRINALTLARALAEAVFDSRRAHPDAPRQALIRWLTTARTKFLMATKVDAVVELDRRLASAEPRNQLRRIAAAAAHDIATELLGRFWERLCIESAYHLAQLSKRMLEDIHTAAGDLLATIPLDGLARREQLRAIRRHADLAFSPGLLGTIAERIGLAGKVELAARSNLIDRLDDGSLQLTARVLDDYDAHAVLFEQRFFELVDGSVESIQIAEELAIHARSEGPEAVVRARARIVAWSARLTEIFERLQ